MAASDAELAGQLIRDRVTQEWSLKESLERRSQFLVGAAATGSSLTVAAAALLADSGSRIDDLFKPLILAAAAVQILVGLLGVLPLFPLRLRVVTVDSLRTMVTQAATASNEIQSNATEAVGGVELDLLESLETQNGVKATLLGLASLAEVVAMALLGLAVLIALDAF